MRHFKLLPCEGEESFSDNSSSGWTLIDTGTLLQVTAIPEPSTFSMIAGALALGVVFTRRRMQ
jgi:hypothetical protein